MYDESVVCVLLIFSNPDLDSIRNYTKKKFGWEQTKCDSLLLPVLKKCQTDQDPTRQLTLDTYISFGKKSSSGSGKRKKGSKRIQTAVKRLKRAGAESIELNLSSESDGDLDGKTNDACSLNKVATTVVKGEKSMLPSAEQDLKIKHQEPTTSNPMNIDAGTSSTSRLYYSPSSSSNSATIVPQRIQSESDQLRKKREAIQIFKRSKTQDTVGKKIDLD